MSAVIRCPLARAIEGLGRDAASLDIGSVDGLAQQSFAFALPLAEPPSERPRERYLDDLEGNQRTE